MTVEVRHMQKPDLGIAVEIERMANAEYFEVPGVGECTALPPWAWQEQDYLDAIRRYRSRSNGTFDTRALVAVSSMTLPDLVPIDLVVGSMIYEVQQWGYEILRMSAHPGVGSPLVTSGPGRRSLTSSCRCARPRSGGNRSVASSATATGRTFGFLLAWDGAVGCCRRSSSTAATAGWSKPR